MIHAIINYFHTNYMAGVIAIMWLLSCVFILVSMKRAARGEKFEDQL
jgi:cell division protein FtsX